MVLLALAQKSQTRQDAYRLVQAHAMATWDEGGHLLERLQADKAVTELLSPEELDACFDLERHLKHVDAVFDRVLGGSR